MAKGNMLQGMTRGKVGDVVFSRLNGEQISRVRNRHPRNPRTNAQLYQRAIMATVMLAYSAGKELFDHSFQGYAKGADCQRRFMKLNAKKLRADLATDLRTYEPEGMNYNDMLARCVAPGSTTPVPYSFIVSEGTYQQNLFVKSNDANGDAIFTLPAVTSSEKVKEYAARQELIAGDIYTMLALVPNLNDQYYIADDPEEESTGYRNVFGCHFSFVRFIVKTGLAEVDTALTTYGQLFDIEYASDVTVDFGAITVGTALNVATFNIYPDAINIGAIGLIRSRRDQDLRSNTTLYLNQSAGESADFTDGSGLTVPFILRSWSQGTQAVGDSSLILEGGDF